MPGRMNTGKSQITSDAPATSASALPAGALQKRWRSGTTRPTRSATHDPAAATSICAPTKKPRAQTGIP